MSNLNVKNELHSIAAAFGWLIAFPHIICMLCMPVEGLGRFGLHKGPWEYGLCMAAGKCE